MMVEALELRRFLSATLENTYVDDVPAELEMFGTAIATNGSLALVATPQHSSETNTMNGKVTLIDTSVAIEDAVVHTFEGPADFGFFGGDVAWVDGKIVIGAEGLNTIYIYEGSGDFALLDTIVNPTIGQSSGFGSSLAAIDNNDDEDLLVGNNFGGVGEVLRFDLDISDDEEQLDATFESSDPALSQLGTHIAARSGDIFVAAKDGSSGVVVRFDATTGDDEIVATYATHISALAVTGNTLFVGSGAADEVYQLNADTGAPVHTYENEESEPAGLGDSIAVNGAQVMFGGMNAAGGAAFVYNWSTFARVETINVPAPDDDGGNFFGDSVAALTAGKYLVADPFDNVDEFTTDSGAVHAYSVTVAPPPTNTAPSAADIAAVDDAVRNQTITFTGTFFDPDLGDEHTIDWDFGDGNTLADGGAEVSHAYATTGTFTVTMTVTDEAGDFTEATHEVTIAASAVVGGTLYVGGTGGTDSVVVKKGTASSTITVNGAGIDFSGSHVVIYGGDGNDTITVSPSAGVSIEAYGGGGNDSIAGGSLDDILVGGSGNDVLYGAAGRDLIIGGHGADGVYGEVSDDILIAPSTVHDDDSAQLNAIMTIWTGAADFATRVQTLRDGLLTAGEEVSLTVNDGVDTLTGKNGDDWFIYNGNEDIATDVKPGELAFVLTE